VQMMMMMITSEAKVEVLLKKRCETKLWSHHSSYRRGKINIIYTLQLYAASYILFIKHDSVAKLVRAPYRDCHCYFIWYEFES
jgi:hypothetical protein